jgi:sulfide:quinone oxidoreductase
MKLILGAGFGGLELATRLSESLADEVHVTLVDQNDAFVSGFPSWRYSSAGRPATR